MADEEGSTLGARLVMARDSAGFTSDVLSGRLGLEPGTLAAWEASEGEPGAYMLNRLAGMTGVSLVWLLGGKGEGPSDGSDLSLSAASRELAQARHLARQALEHVTRAEAVVARLQETAEP